MTPNLRKAAGSGVFAAAACTACCAPPIIAALGLTAGLAAVVGVFVGLAAAVTVVLLGVGLVVVRRRTGRAAEAACGSPEGTEVVAVAAPMRRHRA